MRKIILFTIISCLNWLMLGATTIYVNGTEITGTKAFETGGRDAVKAGYDVNNDKRINAGDVAEVYNNILTK